MSDGGIGHFLASVADRKPWPPELDEQLQAPFADDELRTDVRGFTYPTYKAVVARLNSVFPGCWSAPVTHQEIVGNGVPYVIVRRALIIHHPDYVFRWFENFGGKRIAKTEGRYHVEDDFKAAATMALLKDALDLGIGIGLTGTKKMDEGMESLEDTVPPTDFTSRPANAGSSTATPPASKGSSADHDEPGTITPNQLGYLRDLMAKAGIPEETSVEGLSYNAASARISELKNAPAAKPAAKPSEKPAAKKAEAEPAPAPKQSEKKEPAAAAGSEEKPATAPPAAAPAAVEGIPAPGEPGEREAIMAKAREYIASVIKDQDPAGPKVTKLLLRSLKQATEKTYEALEDASIEDLRVLIASLMAPDD